MFSYFSLEERIPRDHPLRPIRKTVDEIFRAMNRDFDSLYAETGRPSIPSERLLRCLLLQIFYSIRKRADADGADGIQPVVPVARGHGDG